MCRRSVVLVALMIALGLFTVAVAAQSGKPHTKDKKDNQGSSQGFGNEHSRAGDNAQKHNGKAAEHGKSKNKDRDDGWERRDGFEVRSYGDRDARPPGWSKGKKTGWGNCGVPPGHAKKGECRTYQYEGRRYYYYRDSIGRMIVRRPMIDISIH